MLDEVTRRFVFSLIFFVISSILTFVLSSTNVESLLGKLGKAQSSSPVPVPSSLTAHESQIAAALVDPSPLEDPLSSVGGLSRIKQDLLASVVTPLKYAKAFFHPKMKSLHVPRGILLTGPPGCGKTLLARALAKECNCRFLPVSLSSLEDKYFGETSKRVEAVFSLAKKMQPCIVFFDELDGFLRTRTDGDQSCVYSMKTELLSQLDGFHKRGEAVVVVACTNATSSLDPAVRRRLPRVYEIGLPTEEERMHILTLQTSSERVSEETRRWLAKESSGFSGSDLAELYRTAAAIRIQAKCSDPSFHARAAKACSDPRALPGLAKSLSRITRAQWESAMQEMKKSKVGTDFRKLADAVASMASMTSTTSTPPSNSVLDASREEEESNCLEEMPPPV